MAKLDHEAIFKAYAGTVVTVNDETGEHLYGFNTGSSIHGNPTTFTKNGKQYVAIVYGRGGGGIWPLYYAKFGQQHNKGGGLMVFAVD